MKETLLLFILITYQLSFAQNNKIDSIIHKYSIKNPTVGLVIGVINNDKTTYHSYGYQSLLKKTKIDSTTIFEIGSATKTFASLVLAKLIAEDKLKFSDFIDAYFDDTLEISPKVKGKVKITDLVTHQSGLPNLSNDTYFAALLKKEPRNPFKIVDKPYLYKILKNTEALRGYRSYQYNNYAYGLLSIILERLCKVDAEVLIENKVLHPLQMQHTSFTIPNHDNRAGLYSQKGEPQEYLILNKLNLAGGLKSNAVDLIKYLKYLINTNTEEIQLLQLTYYEDLNIKLSLGWERGIDYFQKDGDTFGNSCMLRYSPNKKLGIVVLSNHQNGQLVRDITNAIYNIF